MENALRRQQQRCEEAVEQAEKDYETALEQVRQEFDEQKSLLQEEKRRLLSVGQQISEARGRAVHLTSELFSWEQDLKQKTDEEEQEMLLERRQLLAQQQLPPQQAPAQQPLRLTNLREDEESATASEPKASGKATDDWKELVLAINLKRRQDRLASLLQLPWGLAVDRLEAVDGRALDWAKLVSDGSVHEDGRREGRWAEEAECPTICRCGGGVAAPSQKAVAVHRVRAPHAPFADHFLHSWRRRSGSFSPHLTLAAVGCALSHRTAWQRLARQVTHDWALILEDDVSSVAADFSDQLRVCNNARV